MQKVLKGHFIEVFESQSCPQDKIGKQINKMVINNVNKNQQMPSLLISFADYLCWPRGRYPDLIKRLLAALAVLSTLVRLKLLNVSRQWHEYITMIIEPFSFKSFFIMIYHIKIPNL